MINRTFIRSFSSLKNSSLRGVSHSLSPNIRTYSAMSPTNKILEQKNNKEQRSLLDQVQQNKIEIQKINSNYEDLNKKIKNNTIGRSWCVNPLIIIIALIFMPTITYKKETSSDCIKKK